MESERGIVDWKSDPLVVTATESSDRQLLAIATTVSYVQNVSWGGLGSVA